MPQPDNKRMRVTVAVASLGRPETLAELLGELARQSTPPEEIILSVTSSADLPAGLAERPGLKLVTGPKGLCAQRNTAITHLDPACDILLFCDDDFVPSRFMLERMRTFFAVNADIVGATGRLLADGINGPGFSFGQAQEIVTAYDGKPAPPPVARRDLKGLYGCNMAYRVSAIGETRFDERLPLYGWQEDIDFSAQMLRKGRIVGTEAFTGVHCGVKRGRAPGVKLGYSQIVNPAYLVRKGTMEPRYAAKIVLNNFAANHWRALNPEPWADRAGRAWGNWLGLFDVLRGRLTPERMQQL